MSTLNQLLTEHRRSILERERHAASLEVRHNTGQPAETEIVNRQLEGVVFETDARILDKPCIECGEDYVDGDETTCDFCLHADCEDHPCQHCTETAIDQAMDMMDMER